MARATINLLSTGVGQASKSLNVTAARRLNVYYDIQPGQGDKVSVAAYGTPGLQEWTGLLYWNPQLLVNPLLSGAAAGTPGTAPTSWSFFTSGTGTVVSVSSGTIRLSCTSGRHFLYQNVSGTSGQVRTFSMSVVNYANTTIKNLFAVVTNASVTQYYFNGSAVSSTYTVPIGAADLSADVTYSGTGATTLRVGVGVDGSSTCDCEFSALRFADPESTTTLRGLYVTSAGDKIFAVRGTGFYEIESDGTVTQRGTMFASSEICDMADNGTQLVIAATHKTYCYTFASTAFAEVLFGDVAGQYIPMTTVCFQDGYFIGTVTDEYGTTPGFYLSTLYNGSAWSALDFGVAEYMPDPLVRASSKNGVLYLFGTRSMEVWQNVGDPLFPYQRIPGVNVEFGLVNKDSLVHIGGSMAGLFRNRQNDYFVGVVQGMAIQDVTPPDLAERFRSLDDATDCTAIGYSVAGHDFYQISFITDLQSWLYDLTTGLWSQTSSGQLPRHIALLACPFFTDTEHLVCDYRSGRVFKLTADSYTDDGDPNHREIIGNHIFLADRGMFRINSIMIDMETGTAAADTPSQIRLSLSRDYGHTFGEEYAGNSSIGEYYLVHQFNRLGRGRDIVPKIRMTDDCKFAVLGAVASIDPYGW